MIEKHAAIFVTERTSLIALEESEYSWVTFSWFTDRDFLDFISRELDRKPQPKIKMACDNAQIPSKWLRGTHYFFTFHEWIALCQRFLRDCRSPEGDDSFSEFRRGCLHHSKESVLECVEDLNGLFRVVDFDVYVVLSTVLPHWDTENVGVTSLESMKQGWEGIFLEIENTIKDLMRTENAINTDTSE